MEEQINNYCKEKNIICSVLFEITHKCNLNCIHCILGKKKQAELSYHKAIEIINCLFEEGSLFIILTGGEPLLHPQFKEIYTLLKKKGFIVDIKTNALQINEDLIELFVKYPPNKIAITVYGLNNCEYKEFTGDPYGFDKLIRALKLLQNAEIIFKMTIVANKLNFNRIKNFSYKEFFEEHGMDLEFDYDILNTNSGECYPLNYRLKPEEVVLLEVNERYYFEKIRDGYIKILKGEKTKFSCSGGINSAYINVNGSISCCFYDIENCYSLELNEWVKIKDLLRQRNREIISLHSHSRCFECSMALECNQCPLIASRLLPLKVIDEKCMLSELRREYIESSKINYSLAVTKDIKYEKLLTNFTLREWGITFSKDDDSLLFHYDYTKVDYYFDGLIVKGNIGKSVFYIPVLDSEIAKRTNIQVGHGLKIIKYLSSNNFEKAIEEVESVFRLNNKLHKFGVAPKAHRILLVENSAEIKIFHKNKLYIYPPNSQFLSLEVEHLKSIPLDAKTNVFNGIEYENEELISGITNYFNNIKIIPYDLGTQNLINTKNGIMLIDFFGWVDNS